MPRTSSLAARIGRRGREFKKGIGGPTCPEPDGLSSSDNLVILNPGAHTYEPSQVGAPPSPGPLWSLPLTFGVHWTIGSFHRY